MKILITFFIILISFFAIPVFAKTDPELIEYASKVIFDDCQKSNIVLSENSPIKEELSWPYSKKNVSVLIKKLDSFAWKSSNLKGGGGVEFGTTSQYSGKAILRCDNHVMDITNENYFWDEVKMYPPKSFLKIGSIHFNLFGGISVIGLFSLTIFSIPFLIIYKKKDVTVRNYKISFKKINKV